MTEFILTLEHANCVVCHKQIPRLQFFRLENHGWELRAQATGKVIELFCPRHS